MKFRLFLLVVLVFSGQLYGQNYVYKHILREHGLASNMVYCASQDIDGFIWFGTENGASRFDGKNFVTFTTEDGLTDNEVLEVFSDSKGRTWFICYTGTLCYYFKGKIFNFKNDPKIPANFVPTRNSFRDYFEDKYGTIWFNTKPLFCYSDSFVYPNSVMEKYQELIALEGGLNINYNEGLYCYILGNRNDDIAKLIAFDGKKTVESEIKGFATYLKTKPEDIGTVRYFAMKNGFAHVSGNYITLVKIEGDSIKVENIKEFNFQLGRLAKFKNSNCYYLSSNDSGAGKLNEKMELIERYLPNEPVSFTLHDRNNNLWFTTLGNGVYYLSASRIQEINIASGLKSNEVKCIGQIGDSDFFAGFANGYIQSVTDGKILRPIQLTKQLETQNNLRKIVYDSSSISIHFLGDRTINTLKSDGSLIKYPVHGALKDMAMYGSNSLIYASHNGLMKIDNTGVIDTILYRTRMLNIAGPDPITGKYFTGTTDTLYELSPDLKLKPYLPYDFNKLGRVNDMAISSSGVLYVATYNMGLACFLKDSLILIDERMGLLSNQCRKLYIDNDQVIWVLGASGFSKVKINSATFQVAITNYTEADGFSSDYFTGICKIRDTVYIGTDKGINYFAENQTPSGTDHSVEITAMIVNNNPINIAAESIQMVSNSTLRIMFSGISFSSSDKLWFKYFLKGSDQGWFSTNLNEIELTNLLPGEYEFVVYAINKNLVVNKIPATIRFIVLPQFWETMWFRFVLLLLLVVIVYSIMKYRIKRVKIVEMEKTAVNKKFAELRLEAVRSQMDPHFIFNCLNSIQHYNIKEDYKSAQHFMAEFARLIRKTLSHSKNDFILLNEELELIEIYIKLEKLRFEDAFDYSIEINDNLKGKANLILVPSLIFQPYVENAINHGIRFLRNTKGFLNLSFSLSDDLLTVLIEDNGIGIEASQSLKEKQSEKIESMGMNLTKSRLEVISRIHDLDIQFKVSDKSSENKNVSGTIVTIILPVRYN